MIAFVVRRLFGGIFIVAGVACLTFFAVEAAPGNPFAGLESPKMTQEALDAYKESWGYGKDDTTMTRFGLYIKGLVKGNLGMSIAQNRSVDAILADAIPNTLKLTIVALILQFTIGVVAGVIQALKQNSKLDYATTFTSLFLYSMPGFWLSLMMALIFAVKLGWLPRQGIYDVGHEGEFLNYLKHLVLPSVSLGIAAAASTARFQRSALLEVIRQDYIRTARAKGLSERKVVWKHAMKNALLPTITLFGLYLPFLFSGAIITESIFNWPGMGSVAIKAIQTRDPQLVTAVGLIATTMVVVGSLVADILYAVVDPRVRLK